MKTIKPTLAPKLLTRRRPEGTLAGGRGGASRSPEGTAATSAKSVDAQSIRDAVDALTAMYSGFLGSDRALLDSGFETLVEILEEWRDAVPKISQEELSSPTTG